MSINEFRGEYGFLSNFHSCEVEYGGLKFSSTEAAFQAQKTLDLSERKKFCSMTPQESKKAGRKVKMRADWESAKFDVMLDLLHLKFQIPELKARLLATKNEVICEGNYWHDTCWGVCTCARCAGKGKNHLGRLLMQVREELRR